MTLIYDGLYSGHHKDYILQLFQYIDRHNLDPSQFVFLIHSKVAQEVKSNAPQNLLIISNPIIDDLFFKFGSFDRIYQEYKFLKKYQTKLGFSNIVFLNIDASLYTLFLLSFSNKIKIKGILFKSFYRFYYQLNSRSNWSLFSIKAIVKRFITIVSLRLNRNLKKVFILNDSLAVKHANRTLITDRFHILTDPIPLSTSAQDQKVDPLIVTQLSDHVKGQEQKIILFFGSISKRKNIENTLSGIIKSGLSQQIHVLIIGESFFDYEEELATFLQKQKEAFGAITRLNRFVNDAELDFVFNRIDFVMAAYLNHLGSSGVVALAVKYKKLILGPATGLMADIIIENNLGVVAESTDINHLCEQFIKLSQISDSTPTHFWDKLESKWNNDSFGKPLLLLT